MVNEKVKCQMLRPEPLILFFLAGFSGLAYEVLWSRILSLVFGTDILSITVVLVSYMAGLGIGSLYIGKYIDKQKNHLKIFGILEVLVGVSSFLVMRVFNQLPMIYSLCLHSLWNKSVFSTVLIFILSFLVMFIPTFLMGGALPVMSRVFIKKNKNVAKGVGLLYAINTLGGVAGAFFMGFFLIGNFGVNSSYWLAIIINLSIGIISLVMGRGEIKTNRQKEELTKPMYSTNILKFSLVVATLTGFTGLSYEILWTRVLSIFVANSTYNFTSILVVFLLGIGIGSFIFTKFLDKKRSQLRLLGGVQILLGLYVVLLTPFINRLPDLILSFRELLNISLSSSVASCLLLSLFIMLFPTIGMGITFPLICRIYSHHVNKLGNTIGQVGFFNTIGSVMGPLTMTFIFIPILGVLKGNIIIATLNLIIGIAAIGIEPALRSSFRKLTVSSGLAITGILFALILGKNRMILPPSIFRTPMRRDKVLYYNETSSGTVVVTEDRLTGIRACYTNNSAVCGTSYDALKVVRMLGELPILVKENIDNALVIGFGIGITTATIARDTGIKNIDCVEICPGVREASRYFSYYNNNIAYNPKVNFISGDGRNFLSVSKKNYDIISCDPTHPTLGCGNLYTKEYFELCKRHLKKGGVICQYLPLHKLSPEEFRIVIKTFTSVFPNTTIWLAFSHGILLGTSEKLEIDFERLKEKKFADPYLFSISLFLNESAIKALTKGVNINTDNQPYLEFFKLNSLRRENWELNIRQLMNFRIDPTMVFTNIDDTKMLEKYLAGQRHFLKGLIYKNRGDEKKAVEEFYQARMQNPENEESEIYLQHELKQKKLFR